MTGQEFVGHTGQGHNAGSLVVPVAERGKDGAWVPLRDARAVFPPNGSAEIKGVLATRLRAGDWVIFKSAPGERPRAKFRAIHPRRLVPFMDVVTTQAPDGLRRMLVEIGVEGSNAGDCAVRVATDAVVLVTLSKGEDGRLRAVGPTLSSMCLRKYEPQNRVQAAHIADGMELYDIATSAELGECVDWSTDEEFIRKALGALPQGKPEAAQILSTALAGLTDAHSGRVSAMGVADPRELTALVRIGVLADRLRAEGEALGLFREALRADPVVQGHISREAIARMDAERPALADMVRAELETEVEARRHEIIAEMNAALGDLETAEVAALEARVEARRIESDLEMAEDRRARLREVESSVVARRDALESELATLDERIRSSRQEVTDLDAEQGSIRSSVIHLQAQERDVIGRLEVLSRVEAGLSLPASQAGGRYRWPSGTEGKVLDLQDVAPVARSAGLLTPAGVDAIVRLAVYLAAGEVPLLLGEGADELAELASCVLSGGRVATLFADPTLITLEDLWSRPGGNGPTSLGAAWDHAAKEACSPILCVVSQAERSGARFWFPALADSYRRGSMPEPLLVCLTVVDHDAEEAQLLQKSAFSVEAGSAFDSRAGALAPVAFDNLLKEARYLSRVPLSIDKAKLFGLLQPLDVVPRPLTAMRLARVHAAARVALGDDAADGMVTELARTLGLKPTSAGPNLKIIGRNANA